MTARHRIDRVRTTSAAIGLVVLGCGQPTDASDGVAHAPSTQVTGSSEVPSSALRASSGSELPGLPEYARRKLEVSRLSTPAEVIDYAAAVYGLDQNPGEPPGLSPISRHAGTQLLEHWLGLGRAWPKTESIPDSDLARCIADVGSCRGRRICVTGTLQTSKGSDRGYFVDDNGETVGEVFFASVAGRRDWTPASPHDTSRQEICGLILGLLLRGMRPPKPVGLFIWAAPDVPYPLRQSP